MCSCVCGRGGWGGVVTDEHRDRGYLLITTTKNSSPMIDLIVRTQTRTTKNRRVISRLQHVRAIFRQGRGEGGQERSRHGLCSSSPSVVGHWYHARQHYLPVNLCHASLALPGEAEGLVYGQSTAVHRTPQETRTSTRRHLENSDNHSNKGK